MEAKRREVPAGRSVWAGSGLLCQSQELMAGSMLLSNVGVFCGGKGWKGGEGKKTGGGRVEEWFRTRSEWAEAAVRPYPTSQSYKTYTHIIGMSGLLRSVLVIELVKI